MKNLFCLPGLAIALVMSGCGGDNGDGDSGAPQAHALTVFDITGTAADDVDGVAPISPAENAGQFSAHWSVEDSATLYEVGMAVSLDENASSGDVVFYSRVCGSLSDDCPKAAETHIDCTIDNSHNIGCADDPDDANNLSAFFDVLPKDAFIVIETCNVAGMECVYDSHPVEFQ